VDELVGWDGGRGGSVVDGRAGAGLEALRAVWWAGRAELGAVRWAALGDAGKGVVARVSSGFGRWMCLTGGRGASVADCSWGSAQ